MGTGQSSVYGALGKLPQSQEVSHPEVQNRLMGGLWNQTGELSPRCVG